MLTQRKGVVGWCLIIGVVFFIYGIVVGILWWASDLKLNVWFGYSGIITGGLSALIGGSIYIYERGRGAG